MVALVYSARHRGERLINNLCWPNIWLLNRRSERQLLEHRVDP
jgi:hypothetical protein